MIRQGLHLNHLTLRHNGADLARLDTFVEPGAVLTLMAPSGSGKSTLLAAILGALPPAFEMGGHIHLNGQELTHLPPHDRQIGLLFQDDILFPHLSVAGNLGFGLKPGGNRHQRKARIDTALADMGMAGFGPRDPATLSGGQRARVALLRTLLSEPKALLLDEPFSRLDQSLRAQIRALVFGQAKAQGLPVILVTHDPADASAAGGAVLDLFGQPI
jgi:putative thiamine transport system ATP-binding protein